MKNAPDLDPSCFTAMVRLDQNRAMSQVATKTGRPVTDIKRVTIWGNHSATQYPDLFNAEIDGKSVADLINDQAWIENDFIPTVQQRGKAIIDARGLSSAASAANAAIDHIRDWHLGTAEGEWASMAVLSDGSYGVAEGIISGFPCACSGGKWSIVQGLEVNDFGRAKIDATAAELQEEAAAVAHLV
jgi:malate dehydrogenase